MEPSNISSFQPSKKHTYILVIDGKPQGPFNIEQLKEFKITPGDFVKTAEMDDYKEAHEIAELRALFGFREQALIQYFGSFDQRLLGSALDWFFVSGVCLIATLVLALFTNNKEQQLPIALSLLVSVPLVNFIYHIIMESSARQATYGKQILRIKVCTMDGKRISFGRALWRHFAKIFSAMPFFIGYIFSFFNKQQQCLHDMLANTLVVKDRLF